MKLGAALVLWAISSASSADVNLRGTFVWGHEIEVFRPCGSRKDYWVVGDKQSKHRLEERSKALHEKRGRPYQPVYVELTGVLDSKSKREGFAERFDGQLVVRRVQHMSEVLPKDCAAHGG